MAPWGACLLASALLAEPATLRVGMDPRGAPWVYVPGRELVEVDFATRPRISRTDLARIQGLDVDVMRELVGRLGATPRVVPYAWNDSEKGLLDRAYDLLIDAWTPRASTPDGVVASEPYWEWELVFAVRADDGRFKNARDLADARLGYYQDPVTERALRGMGLDRLVAAPNSRALFELLARREVDAVVYDSAHVFWRIGRDRSFRVVGEPLNRLGYHVGLRRDDPALLARVNAAIHELRASGVLARLRLKWEGR